MYEADLLCASSGIVHQKMKKYYYVELILSVQVSKYVFVYFYGKYYDGIYNTF